MKKKKKKDSMLQLHKLWIEVTYIPFANAGYVIRSSKANTNTAMSSKNINDWILLSEY